jgi:hypothetical protein
MIPRLQFLQKGNLGHAYFFAAVTTPERLAFHVSRNRLLNRETRLINRVRIS